MAGFLGEPATGVGRHFARLLGERYGLVGSGGHDLGSLGRQLAYGRGGLLGKVLDRVADRFKDIGGSRAGTGTSSGGIAGRGERFRESRRLAAWPSLHSSIWRALPVTKKPS